MENVLDLYHRREAAAYPLVCVDAEKIMLVCDNLNTHKPASLYKAFPADEARRIAEKIEFQYTPKHGSWLNMAEIELSVLSTIQRFRTVVCIFCPAHIRRAALRSVEISDRSTSVSCSASIQSGRRLNPMPPR